MSLTALTHMLMLLEFSPLRPRIYPWRWRGPQCRAHDWAGSGARGEAFSSGLSMSTPGKITHQ